MDNNENPKIKDPENILIIEDDKIFRDTLVSFLTKEGFNVDSVTDGKEALTLVQNKLFDLVIADIRLPGRMDGIEILKQIQALLHCSCKMIVMTGYADKDAASRAIKLGVDDYINKPFDLEDFLHVVRKNLITYRLEQDVNHYRELSNIDGLTSLYNHRFFYESIAIEISRSDRYNFPVSLMMIDIDDFKKLNDTFGHITGDMVLKKIAYIFQNSLRRPDLAFRYGGEEFTIILPETSKEEAVFAAERIRFEIEQTSFHYLVSTSLNVTISIGIASYPLDAKDQETLINLADKALYEAKEAGKNKVVTSE